MVGMTSVAVTGCAALSSEASASLVLSMGGFVDIFLFVLI
jgi:hypothetical protein